VIACNGVQPGHLTDEELDAMTSEQLDEMIAEQRKRLPAWWPKNGGLDTED
jgi:hypothetical protein